MLEVRPSEARGFADLGWLRSQHTFSFGRYYDPRFMGHGPLRVINEDRVAPASGFDTHGHRDMEIISYVLDGALEHRDSMEHGSIIRPGDVQLMSAGSGIRHSEFNPSDDQPLHFLQIWLLPDTVGITPRYEQRSFEPNARRGRLQLLVSTDGREDSIRISQDADLFAGKLEAGEFLEHAFTPGRAGWIQVLDGELRVNGVRPLQAGDGVAIRTQHGVRIEGLASAEFLLFDMRQ